MYRYLRDKAKEITRDNIYNDIFMNTLQNMFIYDERIFRPELLEMILHTMGKCALIKTDISDYTPVIVEFVGGARYPDGVFSTAKCFDFIGVQYNFSDWRNNEGIIVVFNSKTWAPSLFIDEFAYKMTECDKSEDCLVHYTRLNPIPIATDNTTKAKIDYAIESISKGKLDSIITSPSIRDIVNNNNGKLIDVLEITDASKSDKIQYLAHYYDTLLSRFYFLCGIGKCDNTKQAQITEDELNRNDDASMMLPYNWYTSRKDCLDKFGLSVDFSTFWKNRIDKILNQGEYKEEENGTFENVEEIEVNEND